MRIIQKCCPYSISRRKNKKIEQDKNDYYSAIEVKRKNKKWTSHENLKKELGIE